MSPNPNPNPNPSPDPNLNPNQVIARFALDADCEPQTYGIGLKEVWRVAPAKHKPGTLTLTLTPTLRCGASTRPSTSPAP